MTRYLMVDWLIDDPAEPRTICCEVQEGMETRKVEVFADGRLGFADEHREHGGSRLGEGVVPQPEELNGDPEFSARDMSAAEFEAIWQRALAAERHESG